MHPRAVALGNVLVRHHRATAGVRRPGAAAAAPASCLLTYTDAAKLLGNANLRRNLSVRLREIAEWCGSNGHPPLNALVVNRKTGRPGHRYDGAGGFRLVHWGRDLARCVGWTTYPLTLP